jgi:rhamnulokinase
MLGTLEGEQISLEELHRFSNTPIKTGGSMHWNIQNLFDELKTGLKKAAARQLPYSSISCDSWGVDYILFTPEGKIIDPVFHYRDARTTRGVEIANRKSNWPEIFSETGIQFMSLNTIYQLAAEDPARLAKAKMLLCIGDAFNYFLSNNAKSEESLVSTTQLYNPNLRQWSPKLLQALGLPKNIFTEIAASGTQLGGLCPRLAAECGLSGIEVIASCSHDTGAAVAAVPASGDNWAYLSSGTWSLMGVELAKPIINDACRELNFTNEIGFGSTVRLLKNIIGLWLAQESRREWKKAGQDYNFAALEKMANEAPAFRSLINPADNRFLGPDDMPAKIAAFCRETGQPEPRTPGETIRCVYESLALLYRRTLHSLEQLTGKKITTLHIVGGGSKDATLNQFAANATQIPVIAGPVEATALGNIIIQAIALGHVKSLAAARKIIKHSLAVKTFQPTAAVEWNAAYARMEKLIK